MPSRRLRKPRYPSTAKPSTPAAAQASCCRQWLKSFAGWLQSLGGSLLGVVGWAILYLLIVHADDFLSLNPADHIHQTMQALIYETERMLPMLKNVELRDAGLIGSLQRLKHYKIAAYSTAAAPARQLLLPDDEKILRALSTRRRRRMPRSRYWRRAKSTITRGRLNRSISMLAIEPCWLSAQTGVAVVSETKDGIQRPCALG
jgi:hypothetical protein